MASAPALVSSASTPALAFQKHPAVPTSNTPPIFEWAAHGWYNLRLDALQASSTLSDAQAELLVKAFEARKVTLPCPECRAHYAQDWTEAPFTLAHARSAAAAITWVEDLKAKIDARVAATPAAAAGASASASASTAASVEIKASAPVPHSRTSQMRAARAQRARAAGAASAPAPALASSRPISAPAAASSSAATAALFMNRGGIGAALRARYASTKRIVPAATAAHRTPTVAAVRAAAAKVPLPAATTAHGDTMQRNVAIASALQQTRANASGHRGCNCGSRR